MKQTVIKTLNEPITFGELQVDDWFMALDTLYLKTSPSDALGFSDDNTWEEVFDENELCRRANVRIEWTLA